MAIGIPFERTKVFVFEGGIDGSVVMGVVDCSFSTSDEETTIGGSSIVESKENAEHFMG